MKVNYGELRHFFDDPGCPDPVWKLLSVQLASWNQAFTDEHMHRRVGALGKIHMCFYV